MRELGESTPVLALAARTIGSPQIRNAGTMGGNLGTCSPAGDSLPVLAALDADVVLASASGERRVKFTDFMQGPRKPDIRPGELVLAAEWKPSGRSHAFLKAGTRNAMVISVAMLALVIDRQAEEVRVGIGSVAPTIIRPREAEAFADGLFGESGWGAPLRLAPSAAAKFGELAATATKPIDDVRGTIAYRRHVVSVMAARALARAGAVA
jgi:CO/xanthine dehydrogenase FAD-binding subunit